VNAPATGGATAEETVRDFYEERAAFIGFDCLVPRSEAEEEALIQTAAYFGLTVADARRLIEGARR
jgi:hypothetical protein